MNKKLIALMIVPIMLTLSGAMAYSAFSGTATTNITAKAGDITVSEYAELAGGYSSNTNITVTGGFGSNTETAYLNDGHIASVPPSTRNLATVPGFGLGTQYLTYYINITNLAPGNWVKIHMNLINNGSVGVIFADPTIGSVSFVGSDVNLSNVTGSLSSTGIFSKAPLYGVSKLTESEGYLFATNTPGLKNGSSPARIGYAFAFGPSVSDFETSLPPAGIADYSFYIGLSAGAGNNYQESSVSIPLIVGVMSDP